MERENWTPCAACICFSAWKRVEIIHRKMRFKFFYQGKGWDFFSQLNNISAFFIYFYLKYFFLKFSTIKQITLLDSALHFIVASPLQTFLILLFRIPSTAGSHLRLASLRKPQLLNLHWCKANTYSHTHTRHSHWSHLPYPQISINYTLDLIYTHLYAD